MSENVYIGLGSNLGDRERNLSEAIAALKSIDDAAVVRRSSLYDSAPFGPPQPRYLNAVVHIECGLSPQRLLTILKHIEQDLGRQVTGKWEARPIDLDILFWEDRIVADANLQVPHLELHNRRFALEPLCELIPDATHPLLKARLDDLLKKLAPPQDVVRVESMHWSDGF